MPWLAEPDAGAQRDRLRHVIAPPDEARAKGAAASEVIRARFTWDRTADVVEHRLRALRQQPVRRQAASAQETPASLRPSDAELVLVIVVCQQAVGRTRLGLESVLAHSRVPYGLVVVSLSADADTATYLDGLRSRTGPTRVVVVRADGHDRGAARAVGMDQTRGRLLAFLDGGAVVTEGWLARLGKCAQHEWPHAGAAGPVTNAAAWPQAVPAGCCMASGAP